jgi:methylthioribose-1-phosphate isomerase
MKVDGSAYRSIWLMEDGRTVRIIDQTKLPHEFVTADLVTVEDAAIAIRDMLVRGAPLIGATGAYGTRVMPICPQHTITLSPHDPLPAIYPGP